MYLTPERCRQVLFSDPEYQMLDSFIVRRGNPLGLRSCADVLREGARLATGTGYAQAAHAVAAGYPEKRLVILRDQVAGLNAAVESGRVGALAATALTTRRVARDSSRAESVPPFAVVVDGSAVCPLDSSASPASARATAAAPSCGTCPSRSTPAGTSRPSARPDRARPRSCGCR